MQVSCAASGAEVQIRGVEARTWVHVVGMYVTVSIQSQWTWNFTV